MRLTYLAAVLVVTGSIAAGCKTRAASSTKDIEVREAGSDKSRVIFLANGKVFLKKCDPEKVADATSTLTRNECDVDSGIEPLAEAEYKKRLAATLQFEEPSTLQKQLAKLERDLEALQKEQLKDRESGGSGATTFLEEIQKVEAKIPDLQARLVSGQTRKTQFDRIIKALASSNNERFYFPGIDFNAALSPFTGAASIILGSCSKKNSLGMVFCDIPNGTFTMGKAGSGDKDAPIHQVTLTKPFEIMATEMPRSIWRELRPGDFDSDDFEGDLKNLPVVNVSHGNVLQFISAVNERARRDNEGYEYRLPTEAEWEFAARAGEKGDFGFPDNVAFNTYANCDSGNTSVKTVGGRTPNAFGLMDMHGNVFEVVLEEPYDYDFEDATDPRGRAASDSSNVIVRGGGAGRSKRNCSSTDRLFERGSKSKGRGLRLVRVKSS